MPVADGHRPFGQVGIGREQRRPARLIGHLVAIEKTAVNWSLDRMPPTDRNVLRLGAYEILHTDTPDRVAIDEAIELAKSFGTAQSAAFVNGILDRVMHGGESGVGSLE